MRTKKHPKFNEPTSLPMISKYTVPSSSNNLGKPPTAKPSVSTSACILHDHVNELSHLSTIGPLTHSEYRKLMGTPAGPGLRYSVVKTYALDAIKDTTPSKTSATAQCSNQTHGPNENVTSQSAINEKKTQEVAAETKEHGTQMTAKRGIQLISAAENQPDNTEPPIKQTTTKVVKMEANPGEPSAAKNTKKRTK